MLRPDASRHPDGRCHPIRVVGASRLATRDACPAPPTVRLGAFEPALSLIRPSVLADFATDVAAVARRAGAGSAGHHRTLESRHAPPTLVAPFATSRTTT